MKTKHILLFFISTFCAFHSLKAQDSNLVSSDSTETALNKYGIRVGGDLAKLARTAFESGYSGFELNADIRFSKRFYAATEFGFEERDWSKDKLASTTSGSYIKIGTDFNAYRNWLGMNNAIVAGLRYGFSSFSQNLTEYPIYTTNTTFPTAIRDDPRKYSGLNATWLELMLGIKTELFDNFYLSVNVQLKRMLNEKKPDNFDNLIIPGFNRTNDYSEFGVGYGYTISYLIPIIKR